MNEEWALHSECKFPWKFHDWITNIDNGERRVRCPRPLVEEAAEGGTEMFVCHDCGPNTKADEDGCCAYCGAECEVKPNAPPAPAAPKRMKSHHGVEHDYEQMCDVPPRCEPVETELDSPNFVLQQAKEFAARGFERVNRSTPPDAPARREWTMAFENGRGYLAYGALVEGVHAIKTTELHPGDVIVGTEARRWWRCGLCGHTFNGRTLEHFRIAGTVSYGVSQSALEPCPAASWQCVVELPE